MKSRQQILVRIVNRREVYNQRQTVPSKYYDIVQHRCIMFSKCELLVCVFLVSVVRVCPWSSNYNVLQLLPEVQNVKGFEHRQIP